MKQGLGSNALGGQHLHGFVAVAVGSVSARIGSYAYWKRRSQEAAQWLHAQLVAFEAICITGELAAISTTAEHCELPFDRLAWAFRADLGIRSSEPSAGLAQAEKNEH
jgi:hypothetical protein